MTGPLDAAVVVTVPPATWHRICSLDQIPPERGVAALVGGHQLAVFRCHDGRLFATDQRDPYSGSYTMSRGIVGTRGDVPYVGSPLHKHAFSLIDGRCLDQPEVRLGCYAVRLSADSVEVGL